MRLACAVVEPPLGRRPSSTAVGAIDIMNTDAALVASSSMKGQLAVATSSFRPSTSTIVLWVTVAVLLGTAMLAFSVS